MNSKEYFWLPPACRLETSKCFLFLTAFGYETEVMMQRATIFHMPVVPVDVKDWDTYAKLLQRSPRCSTGGNRIPPS